MKQKNNQFVELFASVKLALFVLFMLASTSILGTVIPQNEPLEKYVQNYGENWANLFQVLDLDDMYGSWWFTTLLVLLSVNLIVCTLKRLPHVWHTVVQDNLQTPPERLMKMGQRKTFESSASVQEAMAAARQVMKTDSSRMQEQTDDDSALLFFQKGAWTRLGVYAVHLSILIIFVGAIIGSTYGYKGFVTIPANTGATQIYEFGTNKAIPLDFTLVCKKFMIEFYRNGMPKEYKSDLVVIDKGREVYSKSIEVNDPLSYKGLTFYQASYQTLDQLFVDLKNNQSGATSGLELKPRQKNQWEDEEVSVGLLNVKGPDTRGNYRFKIWFSDGQDSPSTFWLDLNSTATIERAKTTYDLTLSQHYATGLQVTKDPGVWYVYAGCTLMLLGIMVTFFLSHRRVWIYIKKNNNGTQLYLCGHSNKNKIEFEKKFNALADKLANQQIFSSSTGT